MPFSYYQNQNENNAPSGKKNFNLSPKLIWTIIGVIFLVILISTSFFVVDQTEQAVILRFGKYIKTVGPGLQTKLPFSIDKNYNVPTQVVQTMTFGYRTGGSNTFLAKNTSSDYTNESMMLTGDLNIIDIEWTVQYKIEDPYKWLFNVESKEQTIHDISRSVLNQLVGDLPILSVMTNERTNIEVEAQVLMQSTFDSYGLGVRIVTVKLQNIVPPVGDVQDAFEDVNKAIQDMNRYINEGKENYNSEIPAAQGEAAKLILVAKGYSAERTNNAKGDVARFESMRDAYQNSKELTKERLYIETMEDIFSGDNGTMTVIDKNLDNFLPIQQIQTNGTVTTGTSDAGGTE